MASASSSSKDPNLPPMGRLGDLSSARGRRRPSPRLRLEDGALTDLAMKVAYTINRFTTDWLGERLRLVAGARGRLAQQLAARRADRRDHDEHPRAAHVPDHRPRAASRPSGRWRCAATSARPRSAWRLMRRCCAGSSPTRPQVQPEHVDRRPLGPGPDAEGGAAGRPGRFLRPQPVRLRAAGQRQEQPRPADPRRPAGRLLDPLRHQRRQQRDPPVRRAGPPARRVPRRRRRRPSTSAGSASAGRWSSSAAN